MRAETRWRNFSFCLLIACQTLYMESAFADDRVAPVVVTPRQQSWLEERTQRWANASEIFEKDTAAGIANGRTILDRDRQVFGTDHQRTLESLNRLADFHFRSQKLQEADDFRRETVEISTRLYGEKSWRTLDFRWKRMQIQHLAKQVKAIRDVQRRGDVAFLAMRGLQKQERFTEAIAKGREVLEAYRQVYGDNNPLRAGVLNDIASNLRRISDYEQARNSAVESLDMYRGWLTNNSPQAASVLNQLALIAFDSGNADLAERYFRQSIEAYERSYPELKPDEIDGIDGPLHNLAALYADRRETARAIEVGERALAARARFGKDSTDYALTQTVLGGLRLNNGDIDAARTLLTEAARTIHAKSPENHFQNDQVSRQLCNLHMYAGEYDEANRVIQELLELGERQGLADSLNHVWPLTSAATVQARMKNYPESELYFDRAFNICRQQVGPKHWRTHDVWNKQARELWAPLRDARDAGQLNETRPRIARLAQLAVEIFGADSVDARNFAMQLRHTDVLLGLTPEQRDEFRAVLEQANQGRELLAAERSDEALPVLLASIGRHEALLGDEPYFLYDSYFDLGRIYVKKSRYDEADAAFERAQSLII
ncbi:MAG: tetratricopeptide repeat protein, partial [Planctomycetaceae bacterium]|nr:tetratricopeptide repeat protein [Planctomycetaceae bacterium]